MSIRFQADANLDPDIGRGLLRREPSIDYQDASSIPDGTPDSEVLRIAADSDRVLVTADIRTMPVHFLQFVIERESPGVLLVPSSRTLRDVIQGLLIAWLVWTPDELKNQVRWLP